MAGTVLQTGLNPYTGSPDQVYAVENAAQVAGPAEVAASLAPTLFRDLTTARQSIQYSSGARWVVVTYRLLPGATAVANQFAKLVINAASDADANGKLATDGSFIAVAQGDDLILAAPYGDTINRLDFLTEQAVGAEKTIFQVLAGVQ